MLTRTLPATAAAVVLLGLTACGSGSSGDTTTGGGPAGGGAGAYGGGYGGGGTAKPTSTGVSTAAAGALKVGADPSGQLRFVPASLAARAGTVPVRFANPASSGMPHGLSVEGNGVQQAGRVVDPGGSTTLSVKLKPGTYTYFCPVPGHRAAGMVGRLTVR